jgi:hypothetical protein
MAEPTRKEEIPRLREAESLLIELIDDLEDKLQVVVTILGETPDRDSDIEAELKEEEYEETEES